MKFNLFEVFHPYKSMHSKLYMSRILGQLVQFNWSKNDFKVDIFLKNFCTFWSCSLSMHDVMGGFNPPPFPWPPLTVHFTPLQCDWKSIRGCNMMLNWSPMKIVSFVNFNLFLNICIIYSSGCCSPLTPAPPPPSSNKYANKHSNSWRHTSH